MPKLEREDPNHPGVWQEVREGQALGSPDAGRPGRRTLVERAIGAAKLQAAAYEEVEHDTGATGQAAVVVVAAALAAGIGSLGQLGLSGVVVMTAASLLGWAVWALVTYLVGTRLLPGPKTEADLGQLLRTLGFAAAPGVFQVFHIIPFAGFLIAIAVQLWQLAAMVVGVRQALDYESTGRAVLVCLVGFVLYLAATVVLGSLLASLR